MKKFMSVLLVFAATLLFSFRPAESSSWALDKAHAKLGFTITHLSVSEVEGWFKTFDAKITTTNDDFSDAVAELTADVNSINTEDEKRDTHLRGSDFFDVAKYSTLTFKSTSFKKVNDKQYKIIGNLTLHGVTKPVTLDATVNTTIHPMTKKPVAGFKITGTLKRTDFGIGSSIPSVMLSDEVKITLNAEVGKN